MCFYTNSLLKIISPTVLILEYHTVGRKTQGKQGEKKALRMTAELPEFPQWSLESCALHTSLARGLPGFQAHGAGETTPVIQ